MSNYFLRPENSLIGLVTRGLFNANASRQEEVDSLKNSLDHTDEFKAYQSDTADPNMPLVANMGKAVKHTGDYLADASTGLFNAVIPNSLVDPVVEKAGEYGGRAARSVVDNVSPLIDNIKSSPTGQAVQKEVADKIEQMGQTYPEASGYLETAKDFVSGGVDIVGSFGALQLLRGKWLNAFAGNTNTKLEGFYGGGKIGQILGAAGVMPTAARRTVQQYFSPTQIEALKQTGIPLGTYEQTLNHLHLINKGIDAKTYKGATKSMEGFRAKIKTSKNPKEIAKFKTKIQELEATRESLRDTLGRDNLTPDKLDAMAKAGKEAGSYQSGIESYQMLLNMQTGKNPELAKLLFGPQAMAAAKVSEGGLSNIGQFAVKNGASEMPESVKNNMSIHLQKAWGISDKNWQNTHIVVKNPVDQHKTMGAEILTKNGTGQFMNQIAKSFTTEQLSDPKIMQDVFKLYQRGNFFDSRSGSDKIKDKLFGKEPSAYKDTPALLKEYKRQYIEGKKEGNSEAARKLAAILKPNSKKVGWTEETSKTIKPKDYTNGVKYDAETGNFTFSASHGSTAKELGGVNVVTVYNVKTGDFWQMLSDEHDMFGQKPIGGDNLVTVMPPVGGNINDLIANVEAKALNKNLNKSEQIAKNPVGYNTADSQYKQPLRTASQDIEARTGVAVPENMKHLHSMGMSPEQMQIAQVIAQSRNAKPSAGSYVTAAGRGLKTASMFDVLAQQYEEDQK